MAIHATDDPRGRFARVPVRVSPRGVLPSRSRRASCARRGFLRIGSDFFTRSRGALSRRRRQRDSLSRPDSSCVSRGSISTTGSERGSPGDPSRTRRYTKLAIVRQLNGFTRLTTTQHSTDDMPPCWMSTFSVHTHPREERPHARAAQIPHLHCSTWWKHTFMGNLESFFFWHFTRKILLFLTWFLERNSSLFDMISRE